MTLHELPVTSLPLGQVSPAVLVCGDPSRAERIAARLDGAQALSRRREFHAYRGHYRDMPLTVCSHGVGAPGAAAAFEELIAAGARRIIRVGTCGAMQPDIQAGHLVIATAAVQNTGYGRETVPDGYPAAADPALTLTLIAAAAGNEPTPRAGLVLSRDGFYEGVAAPAAPNYHALSAARVLAVEMECAALFLVGSLRGVATAAIVVADGNVLEALETMDSYQPGQPVVQRGVDAAIGYALEAQWAAGR